MRSLTSSLLFILGVIGIASPSFADTGVCYFNRLPSYLAEFEKTNECEWGDTAYWRLWEESGYFMPLRTVQFIAEACDLNEKIMQGTQHDPHSRNIGDFQYVVCTYAPKVFRDVSQM